MNAYYGGLEKACSTQVCVPTPDTIEGQLNDTITHLQHRLVAAVKAKEILAAHPEIGEFMDAMKHV